MEDRTPPKTSKDPRATEADGSETAPSKTPKRARGAKKQAKVPQRDKDANKEDDVSKGQGPRRKSPTLRQRGSSKNRETAGELQGPAATGSTKHKTPPVAAEAPTFGVAVTPGTTSNLEPAASAAVRSGAPANPDQIQASHVGEDEPKVPPGGDAAENAAASGGGPARPAGPQTEYTRVISSSDTQAAAAGGSSDTLATAVPTKVATCSGTDQDPAARVIGTKARPNRGAQAGKAVQLDAEATPAPRKPLQARWMTKTSRAEESSTKAAESRNLSPAAAKRIPVTYYVVIVFGSLALLALVAYLLASTGSKKRQYDTCKTPACAQLSKRLLESINRSANPCDSFDGYVCDGWRSGHDISVHEDAFQSILGRLYREVRDMDVPKRGQNALQRAAAFYRSCERVGKGDGDELHLVQELLGQAGVVWPRRSPTNADALQTMLATSVQLRWGAILAFEFSNVAGEGHVFVHMAEELNLLKWKSDEQLHSADSRRRYFEALRDQFAPAVDKSSAAYYDGDVFVTYEETQRLESEVLRHFFQMAPAKVTEKIPDGVMYGTVPRLTKERWKDDLRPYTSYLNVTGPLVFRTNARDLVLQLLTQWRDHGEQKMHLLLSWCAVQMAALFANQKLIVNFYGSKEKAEVAHGVSCFSKAFRLVGDQAFYGSSQQFLPVKMRPTAEDMTLGVRTAFRRRLERWEFYDDRVTVVQDWNSTTVVLKYFTDTSNHFVQSVGGKLEHVLEEEMDMGESLVDNWSLAARASFQDPTSLRLSEDIEDLNTYTLVQSGEQSPDFSLLPYAFAFPYFDGGATRALNYAGVASRMAEALSLLFLDAYDTQAQSAAALTEHFECMEGDASDILGRRDWARRMEPVSLKVALDAYNSAAGAETAAGDRRLEGLEFLSQQQLFFAAACFTRCAGSGASPARRGEPQCDAAFRHVEEFAAAFGCPTGSPLNPEKRCHIL
ncbi:endothelin-converting enzyme 2-like [Dermacentor albipictus]|uniref:endothelin-converting enzyme 2-like n=1 Tax=Dermacentor albipictus TaxID=60249 RepID=UPI0038FD0246